jgi:ATP-dependent Lon protease
MNEVANESAAAGRSIKGGLNDDVLLILPVRNVIVFPGAVTEVALGREVSIAAVQEAVTKERKLGILLQRNPTVDTPAPDDLYEIGTIASVIRHVKTPSGMHHVICQGEQRFRALDYITGMPFLAARFEAITEPQDESPETEALVVHLKQLSASAIELLPQAPPELAQYLESIESPGVLADLIAGVLDIKPIEKQAILETVDLRARLGMVAEFVAHRVQVLKLTKQLDEQTQEKLNERQREFVLREQLKTIQKELGEGEGQHELDALEQAIAEAEMPEEVEQQARKELQRLRGMPDAAAEHSMVRTYLDWLVALPWKLEEEPDIDIARARAILDSDHYGLVKVKRRILEYLAVRRLNPTGRSPILCFVGPPGVGKTSLGQSIAQALGLKFVRASLGGVHDEAEIRGHRRTYVGAMPGTIMQSIRKAGARNAVFMLDEMDKLGVGFHGDPSSALLEVLDPEQNATFKDHYLDVPFDLSKVLFIGTANVLDNIPGPLRDRMEVIELTSYTMNEKLEIAKRYLLARQLQQNGLDAAQVEFDENAIAALIEGYTREAGVRDLDRQIGAVLRNVAMRVAEGEVAHVAVHADDLAGILGAPKFESEVRLRTSIPGVATGLAWTPVGGEILFIEASRVKGNGKLILTGQLGDVMKESAQAAVSLVKSRLDQLGAEPSFFDEGDLHIHIPAGAIPKDGPSAGVAMFVAVASLLCGCPVRSDVAMTGEISLRGLVLPVGGIKEKVLGAHRAGIRTVLLPARNKRDIEEIPEATRADLEFVWLETVDDALRATLESDRVLAERASSGEAA